ncbi:MAG: formyltransferase family protein [Patescibacteria group bacterium]
MATAKTPLPAEILNSYGHPGQLDYSAEQAYVHGVIDGKMLNAPTDVAVIADRSALNLESLMAHAGRSSSFRLRGVLLPGSELDHDVERLTLVPTIERAAYDGSPEVVNRQRNLDKDGFVVDRGNFTVEQVSPILDASGNEIIEELFRSEHFSYEAKKLRMPDGEGDTYRRALGAVIIEKLSKMTPDVIFLDNFKVILPPNVVRAFVGKFVNVHPSILPLIKGFRPEKRAMQDRENPAANGYTMHVVSEDLDGGPTLLQQRVLVLPKNKELLNALGREEYHRVREEQARLRIMLAQAPYVPKVLHLYNSSLDRKLVEGSEAFAAEGRPGFEKTSQYKVAQAEDADAKPYQRYLFEDPLRPNEYVTLEKLLSVPKVALIANTATGVNKYEFTVPVLTDDKKANFTQVEYLVRSLRAAGVGARMETGQILPDQAEVELTVLGNCASELQAMGVEFSEVAQPVHVLTKRQPVAERRYVGQSIIAV